LGLYTTVDQVKQNKEKFYNLQQAYMAFAGLLAFVALSAKVN
jgi:hypothetical protein